MDSKLIEAAARAFVTFNTDNEWSLSQVQGFRYGQDHVVRDCMLPGDRQEIWRRPVSETSPEDMRDFIELYRAKQAMEAAILAFLDAEGTADKIESAVAEGLYFGLPEVNADLVPHDLARSIARAALSALKGEKP
jgi:hypothetical protein